MESTCKVVLLGDTGVGKTTFLHRYHKDLFVEDFKPTIGVDFRSFYRNVSQQVIKVQMWDTAGQERFRSITRLYYQNTNGILLFYDTTNLKSFNKLAQWIDEYRLSVDDDKYATIIIVGTKCDLIDLRQVQPEIVSEFCDRYNCRFIETSSKTGFNIQETMDLLLSQMVYDNNIVKTFHQKLVLDNSYSYSYYDNCCYS
jgi:small GTP-binding protein